MRKEYILPVLFLLAATLYAGFATAQNDVVYDGASNTITISCPGGGCAYTIDNTLGQYQITEANGFSVISIPGLLEINSNTLIIAGTFDGTIIINGNTDNDQLIVDYQDMDISPIPPGGIQYNGDGDTGGQGDVLQVANHPAFDEQVVKYTGSDPDGFSGSLELAGRTITYTGLEPITFTGSVVNVNITLPNVANPDATLKANATSGFIEFSGSTFEDIIFPNPTGTITINGGSGQDVVTIENLDGSSQAYSIDIGSSNGVERIVVTAGNINLSGSNSISLTAVGPSGTADGISLGSVASVKTDAGAITLEGKGGSGSAGILLNDGAEIASGTGDITLTGTGGSTGASCRGVFIGTTTSSSTKVSSGGAIKITGTGGSDGASGIDQQGVRLFGDVEVSGSSSITIMGTGGKSSANNIQGVTVGTSTAITSEDGNIEINGMGGSVGTSGNAGVVGAGLIESTGSGNILLTGTGASGSNAANGVNVLVNGIVRVKDGDITITGTGGSGPNGGKGIQFGFNGAGNVLSLGSGAITLEGTGTGGEPGLGIFSGSTSHVIGGPSHSGNILIKVDTYNFPVGSIQSTGNLTIEPLSAGTTIGIGSSATGTLNLTPAELARFANGFSKITIGNTSAGNVDVNASTFNDDVKIVGNNIDVIGLNAGTNSVELEPTNNITSTASGTHVTANSVFTAGTLSPGTSPGIFKVAGSLIVNGSLLIEITGPSSGGAGVNFDQVQVSNSVQINGNLNINFGSYVPTAGDSYLIIMAAGFAGLPTVNISPVNINASYDFSGTINIGTPALPVELLYFRGQWKGQAAELEWATATERDNAYFELQRSADGRTFDPIGQVAGAGNHQGRLEYRFTDPAPYAGISYYRFRQVDFDGAFEFSPIISLMRDEKSGTLRIFPNPASGRARIELPAELQEQVVEVAVYNLAGQQVLYRQLPVGEMARELPLNGLPAGWYSVQVEAAGQGYTAKLQVVDSRP